MIRQPPRATRTDPPFPYTPLSRSTREAAERLDGNLGTVATAAGNLAGLVAHANLEPAQMAAALRSTVDTTPGISGGLLALEPGHPDDPRFARYFGSAGRQRDFVADGHAYRGQAWYRQSGERRGGQECGRPGK